MLNGHFLFVTIMTMPRLWKNVLVSKKYYLYGFEFTKDHKHYDVLKEYALKNGQVFDKVRMYKNPLIKKTQNIGGMPKEVEEMLAKGKKKQQALNEEAARSANEVVTNDGLDEEAEAPANEVRETPVDKEDLKARKDFLKKNGMKAKDVNKLTNEEVVGKSDELWYGADQTEEDEALE